MSKRKTYRALKPLSLRNQEGGWDKYRPGDLVVPRDTKRWLKQGYVEPVGTAEAETEEAEDDG